VGERGRFVRYSLQLLAALVYRTEQVGFYQAPSTSHAWIIALNLYPNLGYFKQCSYSVLVRKSPRAIGREALLDALRGLRSDVGLTQAELAARLGRPQSFVSKYESGERRLDLIELSEVCLALGISLEKFVARVRSKAS
jgi:DNA-binding XRE family transcriptional regulator